MLPLAEGDWITDHLMHTHPFPLLPERLAWFGDMFGLSGHVFSLFVVWGLMYAIFPRIAKDQSLVPTGMRNLFEIVLVFLRDELARPFLGHNTEKFLPVLWTFFFFILFSNLLGLVPGFATATGQIWVTGALAFTAFVWWHACGIWEQGLVPYVKNIVPPGVPFWLWPALFLIELIGHLVKPMALMIRLWANMTGGHASLYVFIGFTFIFQSVLVGMGASAAAVAIYFLELLVAFIQAYVFTFLVTVFLGSAVHPEH